MSTLTQRLTYRVSSRLRRLADWLENTAYPPLTDDQLGEVVELLQDCASDYSTRETTELLTERWTNMDWQEQWDGIVEANREEEDYDLDAVGAMMGRNE